MVGTAAGKSLPVRTSDASELGAFVAMFADGALVSFEVDQLNATAGDLWSVLVCARVARLDTEQEHALPPDRLPVPAPSGPHAVLFRLTPIEITGRHLVESARLTEEVIMLVREVMTANPVTVRRDTPVKEALRVLADHQISALPVVSSADRLCGMVSEVDLIRDRVPADPRAHELPVEQAPTEPAAYVEDVMNPVSVAVRDDAEAATAVALLAEMSLKSLPVLDDGERLVGVVSRSDVVRVLARADSVIARQVMARMADLGHRDWLVEVADGMVEVIGPTSPGTVRWPRPAQQPCPACPGCGCGRPPSPYPSVMGARLPLPTWVRGYQRAWLRGDVLAGVTVAAYLVPQVMAYAELAGLPAGGRPVGDHRPLLGLRRARLLAAAVGGA